MLLDLPMNTDTVVIQSVKQFYSHSLVRSRVVFVSFSITVDYRLSGFVWLYFILFISLPVGRNEVEYITLALYGTKIALRQSERRTVV